jgi:HSP20 family protein
MATMTPVKTQQQTPAVPDRAFPFLLSRLRDEFDEVFDRLGRAWVGWKGGNGAGWRWGLEVTDKEDAISVRAEAPGFAPAEIDVQVTDDTLVIRARKKEEKKGKEGEEVSERECYESISLPAGINKDKVEAQYQNGVLTVTLPKTEKAKGRKVPVKAV